MIGKKGFKPKSSNPKAPKTMKPPTNAPKPTGPGARMNKSQGKARGKKG